MEATRNLRNSTLAWNQDLKEVKSESIICFGSLLKMTRTDMMKVLPVIKIKAIVSNSFKSCYTCPFSEILCHLFFTC